MKTIEVVQFLRKQGFEIEFRVRTDGGIIVTKVNNMKFTAAGGNTYVRSVAGGISPAAMTSAEWRGRVALSEKKLAQVRSNAEKLIRGKKVSRLDDEMRKELRKVQRAWRKSSAQGRITAKKVKWHIANEGRRAALDYLNKMGRYAKGFAYEENVRNLATYTADVGRGAEDDNFEDELYSMSEYILSIAESFLEKWINPVYAELYTILKVGYEPQQTAQAISNIWAIIKS